jgi:Zinc carboxypeptidase
MYAGSAAFSEVENRNIGDFLTSIASTTNVAITIHSYSQLWLIPWSGYSYKPSDYDELVSVALTGLRRNKYEETFSYIYVTSI